ncbi:MAG: hypothetical protein IJN39_06355 [Clostridia bacterium]|nr:hypothetical protein [Clostridia bacterium]
MKKVILIIVALVLIVTAGIFIYRANLSEDVAEKPNEEVVEATVEDDGKITEIPLDSVKGITEQEAEELCYTVMGEKDSETGFLFSFGVSGAVEVNKKQYYVVRGSWLVNNSHMSYIGDFFVSADGKEIITGTALSGEYTMDNTIWEKP